MEYNFLYQVQMKGVVGPALTCSLSGMSPHSLPSCQCFQPPFPTSSCSLSGTSPHSLSSCQCFQPPFLTFQPPFPTFLPRLHQLLHQKEYKHLVNKMYKM